LGYRSLSFCSLPGLLVLIGSPDERRMWCGWDCAVFDFILATRSMMTDFSQRLAALTTEHSRDEAGDPNRLARIERTRIEMMNQGSAIAKTVRAEANAIETLARFLRGREIRRVVVTGCGDSWFIGAGVRHAFERLIGVPFEAAQALEYAAYGAQAADPTTLVVGVSAGGDTPAVLSALERSRKGGAITVGISNRVGSAILKEFDAGLVVHATRSGWPTQSSTAAMALLIRLAERWAPPSRREGPGTALDVLSGLVDKLAVALDDQMATLGRELAAARLILFAGLGPNLAAASFGAAKIRELAPIHAFALPLEEYHHYRTQKRGDPLFLIATDWASRERALDTALISQRVGGRTIAILADDIPEIERRIDHVVRVPPVDPILSAIVSSIPLHLFAYHFAKARDVLETGASPVAS
jgi:glutamine---fructose-6-phosphate transaminase (isomerizing)